MSVRQLMAGEGVGVLVGAVPSIQRLFALQINPEGQSVLIRQYGAFVGVGVDVGPEF